MRHEKCYKCSLPAEWENSPCDNEDHSNCTSHILWCANCVPYCKWCEGICIEISRIDSMSRDIPFDTDEICDLCGRIGALDFMGDLMCYECLDKEIGEHELAKHFVCPVCKYRKLKAPPINCYICPCCGVEFGIDDLEFTHDELRCMWIDFGMPWFSDYTSAPENWDPAEQLKQ